MLRTNQHTPQILIPVTFFLLGRPWTRSISDDVLPTIRQTDYRSWGTVFLSPVFRDLHWIPTMSRFSFNWKVERGQDDQYKERKRTNRGGKNEIGIGKKEVPLASNYEKNILPKWCRRFQTWAQKFRRLLAQDLNIPGHGEGVQSLPQSHGKDFGVGRALGQVLWSRAGVQSEYPTRGLSVADYEYKRTVASYSGVDAPMSTQSFNPKMRAYSLCKSHLPGQRKRRIVSRHAFDYRYQIIVRLSRRIVDALVGKDHIYRVSCW